MIAVQTRPGHEVSGLPPREAPPFGDLNRDLRWFQRHKLIRAWPLMVERGMLDPRLRPVARAFLAGSSPTAWREEWDDELGASFACHAVDALILKGGLLGRTVYENPSMRPRCDSDWLVRPSQGARARQCLEHTGLHRPRPGAAQIGTAEELWRNSQRPPSYDADVHWVLNSHPAFSSCFSFEELWERRTPVGDSDTLFGLSLGDALIHASIHYYGHHAGQFKPHLWLLDVDLIWRALSLSERTKVVELSEAKGISGIVRSMLSDAERIFATPVDEGVRVALTKSAATQWRSRATDPQASWIRRRALELRGLPSWRARFKYIMIRLVPPVEYLRWQRPDLSAKSRLELAFRRFARALFHARNRRDSTARSHQQHRSSRSP